MRWETQLSPCTTRLSRVRGSLAIMLPDQQGRMIAGIMAAREGKTSRITGTVHIKLQLWMLSSKVAGTARSPGTMAHLGTRTRTIVGKLRIRTDQQRTGSLMRRCWIAHASTTPPTPGGQQTTRPRTAVGTSVHAGKQQEGTTTQPRRDTHQGLRLVRLHKPQDPMPRRWDRIRQQGQLGPGKRM